MLRDRLDDTEMDLVDRAAGVQDGVSLRFLPGHFEVTRSDALVERQVLLLEARLVLRAAVLALAGALERETRVDVEQERQVGAERQCLEIVQGVDQVERDGAAVPLIREGRVLEAIAQHEARGVEGGPDDLVDMLGAGRGVQQELADRRHDGVPGVEDEPAEDRKSTRLNSSHDQISYAVFCLKQKKI